MSNDLFEHDFNYDLEDAEPTYPISDVQWIYINDINQNNYAGGFINWTNVAVIGSSIDKQYGWSQGYVSIPYSVTATLSKAVDADNYTFDNTHSNAYALGLKGNHHLIDWASIKFNGVQCNRGSYYNNFYVNEQLKQMNEDEYKIYGDILNHAWDIGSNIDLVQNIGEVNNNTVADGLNLTNALKPNGLINTGHIKRMQKTNVDIATAGASSLNKFTTLGNALLNDTQQCILTSATGTVLTFDGIALIPLKYVHNFFGEMPSVASSLGFELRLQCNIAKENSWTTTYAANSQTLTSVVSNQIVGHTCPFILSPISNDGSTGLEVTIGTNHANTYSIKLEPKIGWSGTTTAPACRIYLPAINYTPLYTKQIVSRPQHSIRYKDYYIDFDLNKKGGDQISRLFNVQLARVRNLYIIPFISNQGNTGYNPVNPYNSPVSSAPNTCSPCKLKNMNIQIGGQNIFSEPQSLNSQFYFNNFLSIMSHINGNSLKSKFFGAQITKSMWENGGYNTYVINLKKVSDEVADSLAKSFQLIFQLDSTNNNILYDFMYIIDQDCRMNIDRATGEITSV